MKLSILALAAMLACGAAHAGPKHGAKAKTKAKAEKTAPKRFVKVPYVEESVVPLNIAIGRMLEIQFAPDETQIDFKMGDRKAWNVSVVGNTLLLKPGDADGDTNMRVITNRRRYFFDLTMIENSRTMPYQVRFTYPAEPKVETGATLDPVALAAHEKNLIETRLAAPLNAVLDKIGPRPAPSTTLNDNYGFAGPDELLPIGAYDDGDMTYIMFAPNNPMPAVFVIEANGEERRVEYHVAKDVLVVHRTARHLIFKIGPEGKVTGCLINGSFRANGAKSTYTVSSGVERTIKSEASDVPQ